MRMDLVALQEIRWLGNGTLEKKNCLIFYSCNPVRHVFGIGFYVTSRFLSNILHFETVMIDSAGSEFVGNSGTIV